MRALTVWQPWAELIAAGIKPVENRPRPLSFRGPIAIHAGLGWDTCAARDRRLIEAFIASDLARVGDRQLLPHEFVFGSVIAVAELVDCHRPLGRVCCGPWGEPHAWHLVLEHVRRVDPPVRARGQQGLWHVTLPGPASPSPDAALRLPLSRLPGGEDVA